MGGSSSNDTGGGGGVDSVGGSSATDRADNRDTGVSGGDKEGFDRAMDNAERPDRAPAAAADTTSPADDGNDQRDTDEPDDRAMGNAERPDRAAAPSPNSPSPADRPDDAGTTDNGPDDDDRGFLDRVADTLSAPPTDAAGNARSSSPVADRIGNHTQNYSVDDIKDIFAANDPPVTPEQSQALEEGAAVMDGVPVSKEFCTIEVRSKTISGYGKVEYGPYDVGPFDVGPFEQPAHAYVVTTDSVPRPDAYLGPETIHRGGPESRTQTPVDGSVWGDIFTVSDRYEPGVPDYTIEERPAVTVGVFGGNCDAHDVALEQASVDIQSEHHDYSVLGPNSNTAVTEMLDRNDLPVPDDYPGWTPGSEMDLQDDKPPTNPDRSNDWFWERW